MSNIVYNLCTSNAQHDVQICIQMMSKMMSNMIPNWCPQWCPLVAHFFPKVSLTNVWHMCKERPTWCPKWCPNYIQHDVQIMLNWNPNSRSTDVLNDVQNHVQIISKSMSKWMSKWCPNDVTNHVENYVQRQKCFNVNILADGFFPLASFAPKRSSSCEQFHQNFLGSLSKDQSRVEAGGQIDVWAADE